MGAVEWSEDECEAVLDAVPSGTTSRTVAAVLDALAPFVVDREARARAEAERLLNDASATIERANENQDAWAFAAQRHEAEWDALAAEITKCQRLVREGLLTSEEALHVIGNVTHKATAGGEPRG